MNQKALHNVSPQSASQMIDDDPPAILVDIRSHMSFFSKHNARIKKRC